MHLYTSSSYFKDIDRVSGTDCDVKAARDIPQGVFPILYLFLGTLLLYVLPAIICPKYEMLSGVCHYCYKSFSKLSRCSKCRLVRYCCKECQKADWYVFSFRNNKELP